MIVQCPICKEDYEKTESWKRICFDCYQNYRYCKRIEPFRGKFDAYLCHPSVTKEELDQWIKDNKKEIGWGVEEYDPHKRKIWINSTNYD